MAPGPCDQHMALTAVHASTPQHALGHWQWQSVTQLCTPARHSTHYSTGTHSCGRQQATGPQHALALTAVDASKPQAHSTHWHSQLAVWHSQLCMIARTGTHSCARHHGTALRAVHATTLTAVHVTALTAVRVARTGTHSWELQHAQTLTAQHALTAVNWVWRQHAMPLTAMNASGTHAVSLTVVHASKPQHPLGHWQSVTQLSTPTRHSTYYGTGTHSYGRQQATGPQHALALRVMNASKPQDHSTHWHAQLCTPASHNTHWQSSTHSCVR